MGVQVTKTDFACRLVTIRSTKSFAEVAGVAAHYTFDHRNFDGFIFPTYRRVVMRDANNHTLLTAPSTFRLDIESVVLSRG
jgi:hypothetical protein